MINDATSNAKSKALWHCLTNPLVQQRKALTKRIEKLWPSYPIAQAFDTIIERIPADDRQRRTIRGLLGEDRMHERLLRSRQPLVIDPRYGVAFVDKRIVWGSSDFPYREHSINFSALYRRHEYLPTGIIGHGHFSHSYYHFFDDFLVKAIAADDWDIPTSVPLIVPFHIHRTPFFNQAVAMGFFGDRPVIRVPKNRSVKIGEAYVVRPPILDYARFEVIADRLKRSIARYEDRRIYIARSPRFGRRVINQTELQNLLHKLNVQSVELESLSLDKQIELFANSSLIVGVHGAGLVNMMFRSGPCTVIEVQQTGFKNSLAYKAMAHQRGFKFREVEGISDRSKGNKADYWINIDDLENQLLDIAKPAHPSGFPSQNSW